MRAPMRCQPHPHCPCVQAHGTLAPMNSICDGLNCATLAYLGMIHLPGPHRSGPDASSIKQALVAAHQLGLKADADTTIQWLLDETWRC